MHTDFTTTNHPTCVAGSADVKAKATHLAVRYLERGRFDVSSGSRPGLVHRVAMPRQGARPSTWACTCDWSQFGNTMCSHVRAAQLEAERICSERGITPAWAPKSASLRPMLPAPMALPAELETYETTLTRGDADIDVTVAYAVRGHYVMATRFDPAGAPVVEAHPVALTIAGQLIDLTPAEQADVEATILDALTWGR